MATATITINLPTARADGSPFAASSYGGATVFANGTEIAKLTAPGLSTTDPNVVPGTTVYTATIHDTQTPPAVSALSPPVTAPSIAQAAPGAPTLTVTVAP